LSDYLKQMMIHRLKNISHGELIAYSKTYGFSLSAEESREIIKYLRHLTLNPFKNSERKRMFYDLKQLTDERTAMQAKQLFEQLIRHYKMEHLFYD